MSQEQTLLTVLQACNCKYLTCVEFLWKRNWCVLLTRILRLIFLVGKKMNSDAVDTRFGDLVTQRNCSFAAAKLPCWSGSNHVANSVLNTLQWGIIEHVPEVTKNDVKTTIWGWRFLAKEKSEESSCHCHPALSTFLGTCVSDLGTTRKHVLRVPAQLEKSDIFGPVLWPCQLAYITLLNQSISTIESVDKHYWISR